MEIKATVPWPMEAIRMTEVTPIIIPNIVRDERRAFCLSAVTAELIFSRISILRCAVFGIGNNFSIDNPDDPMSIGSDILFVSNNNNSPTGGI